ncbi:hypothetical protein VNO78_12710 [Psophocarpus tetragonolobus]|uniref:Uncharacterized protein n=1 Tax=Psophocarpus tetragonolobus TaxID=3891 RepID=A0AAN9SNQ1_PSOTE
MCWSASNTYLRQIQISASAEPQLRINKKKGQHQTKANQTKPRGENLSLVVWVSSFSFSPFLSSMNFLSRKTKPPEGFFSSLA